MQTAERQLSMAELAAISGSMGLLVAHQMLLVGFTPDDSYISMQYARNLAAGHGLCFNPGEAVEGFSNFLWVLLLALGSALGIDVPLLAKFLGSAAALGTLALAMLLAWRLADARWGGMLALGVLLASNTGYAYYSISGMETALFGLWPILAAWCLTRSRRAAGLLPLVGLAAALTRPEGMLLLLITVAWSAIRLAVAPPGERRPLIVGLAAALFGFAAFMIFRRLYFGLWLPNTFYAKPFDWISDDYTRPWGGLHYTLDFLRETGAPALLLLGLAGLFGRGLAARLLLGLAVVCGLVFVLWANDDWMDLSRFWTPYLPTLALLLVLGWGRLTGSKPLGRGPAWALLALVSLLVLPANAERTRQFRNSPARYPYNLMSGIYQRDIGRQLARLYPGGGTVATKRIGAVGYYSGLRVIDAFGLIDHEIATVFHENRMADPEPVRKQLITKEVFSRRPDLVLVYSDEPLLNPSVYTLANDRSIDGMDQHLWRAALERGYHPVIRWPAGSSGRSAYLYARPGFVEPAEKLGPEAAQPNPGAPRIYQPELRDPDRPKGE